MDHAGTGNVQGVRIHRISLTIDGHAALSLFNVMDLKTGVGVGMRCNDRTKFLYAHMDRFDQQGSELKRP